MRALFVNLNDYKWRLVSVPMHNIWHTYIGKFEKTMIKGVVIM